MAGGRPSSRHKILAAAAALAREAGPGHVSLEAVAARAGVSKGGLLYHFPSKAKLMQGLVEDYIADFENALARATSEEGGNESFFAAYVRLSLMACDEKDRPASWIFSAMAEDPDFLAPIREFRKRTFDRLRAEVPDRTHMLMSFLAVEGLHCMKLFGTNVLTPEERSSIDATLLGAFEPTSSRADA